MSGSADRGVFTGLYIKKSFSEMKATFYYNPYPWRCQRITLYPSDSSVVELESIPQHVFRLLLFKVLIRAGRRRKRVSLAQRDTASYHLSAVIHNLVITALWCFLPGFKALHHISPSFLRCFYYLPEGANYVKIAGHKVLLFCHPYDKIAFAWI